MLSVWGLMGLILPWLISGGKLPCLVKCRAKIKKSDTDMMSQKQDNLLGGPVLSWDKERGSF